MPFAVAVSPVIPNEPVKTILSVAFAAWASVPEPARFVVTLKVLLFVSVTAVTVTLGMENVPVSACAFVLKVCIPVPAVNVPLLVIPP